MKKNIFLITLVAVALFTACQKKVLSEREALDSRARSSLEVQYALDGNTVQSLNFSHSYTLCELAVTVNNEGLRWKVESDRAWCKVLPGDHRGNGTVTLELDANDSFDDRSAATLTFVAGDFRGFSIQVNQSASTFVVGQPYFVAGPAGAAYDVEVTTLTEKADWNFEPQSDWITASIKSTGVPVEGKVTKVLSLTAAANNEASRLGFVTLSSGAEKDALSLWQFGTDFDYDGDMIFFPSDSPAELHLLAPVSVIKKAALPDFCTQQVEKMGEDREKWTISFADHLSDCAEMRDTVIKITLSNNVSLSLPRVEQDYVPAHALTTAKGVQLFAQKVAGGESTADWEKDGWVTMLNDIDMTGVTAWAGIGTTEHPFSGKFDGKGKAITNLKQSSSGFFNVCAGEGSDAYIQGLTMGRSCSFVHPEDKPSSEAFGGIVNIASKARIIDCSNQAPITFRGSSSGVAVLGGIVGRADDAGVVIRGCHMEGKMTVACKASTAQVGGIAGYALKVDKCDFSGSIVTESADLNELYAGGITTRITSESVVFNNAFTGSIEAKSGNVASHYLGGLYAVAAGGTEMTFDKSNDMSTSSGKIDVQNYKGSNTKLYIGGFVGMADGAVTLSFKGFDVRTSFAIDHSVARSTEICCVGGILGGSSSTAKVTSLLFEDVTTQGTITFSFVKDIATGVTKGFYGGVAGYIFGPATFRGCVNKGVLGEATSERMFAGLKNDPAIAVMGGIAGYAEGGNMVFSSCSNSAMVLNPFWSNRAVIQIDDSSKLPCIENFCGVLCGGILGAFDFHLTGGTYTLTMDGCANSATIDALRGIVGGIAGFGQNATINSCSSIGKAFYTTYKNDIGFHQGGIMGGVINATINACTVKSNLHAATGGSSNWASPGGIVGMVIKDAPVTVSNCSYYGTLAAIQSNKNAPNKPLYIGGIVGRGMSQTKVSHCRFGGYVRETSYAGEVREISISEDNLLTYVIGNAEGTQQETRLWDGN